MLLARRLRRDDIERVAIRTPKTIRAERYEMVESQGRVRGYWRMSDEGSPCFTLYDAEGLWRAAMSASPSGGSERTLSNAAGVVLSTRIGADGRASTDVQSPASTR